MRVADPMVSEDQLYRLDKAGVRRAFERAAAGYDSAAVVQREIGRRLLARLELMRIDPAVVVDLGSGTGATAIALTRRYRGARVVALDLALAMLQEVRRRRPWFSKLRCVAGDMERLPLADASVDLLFSNLMLQWATDVDAAFTEFHRVLRPGGLLLFTTFGPDTLRELRTAWSQVDGDTHVNAFIDMHDIGDALLRAGLRDPVMDLERLCVTYPDVRRLMHDLKAIGAHNVTSGRPRGLTGKGRLQRMVEAYEAYRRDGVLPATYEVVYGHAWGGAPTGAPVEVPLQRLYRGGKP
jgi:malonyl-CoA O-methyltransferase